MRPSKNWEENKSEHCFAKIGEIWRRVESGFSAGILEFYILAGILEFQRLEWSSEKSTINQTFLYIILYFIYLFILYYITIKVIKVNN